MTIIKTSCMVCGNVELTPNDLLLIVYPGDDCGEYEFTCEACDTINIRPANQRIVAIMLASGVEVRTPPITEHEIDGFVRSLTDL
jgi:hypothetical protein